MMNQRLIVLMVFIACLALSQSADAATVKLLENTDRCEYNDKLKLDHCFSRYLICSNESMKASDIRFEFRDNNDMLYRDSLGDKLDTEIEIEKQNESCLEVSITGWKNPFIDVDNVPCYSECFYEYAWWNSSMTRWPIMSIDNSTGMHYINDSYGVDSGTGIQYIECYINDWSETVYAYNDTNGIWYCANSTTQFNSFVDEGVGTDYGSPDESLLGWWVLGDCSGTNCPDHSRYGNDGTKKAAAEPANATGKIGGGQQFDGAAGDNDYINCGNDASLDQVDDMTINAWIYRDNNNAGGIVTKRDAYAGMDWELYDNANTLDMIISTTTVVTTGAGIPTGEWLMLTYTRKGDNHTLYINSVVNVSNINAAAFGTGDSVRIGILGADTATGWTFDGRIDNVEIYNVSKSPSQIEAIYKNEKPTTYWPLGAMETYIPPDTTPPNITYIPPTPDNETLTTNWTYINVSIDEPGYCLLEWNGTNETMNNITTNYYLNQTLLLNGNYTFLTWCNDTTGNMNVSGMRWVYINWTVPTPPALTVCDVEPIIIFDEWRNLNTIAWNFDCDDDEDDIADCSDCDDRFVNIDGDTMTGNLIVNANFTVDGDDFFVDSSTGRVGIGTTTPDSALDVTGAATGGSITNVYSIESGTGSAQPLRLFGRTGIDFVADINNVNGPTQFYWMFNGDAVGDVVMELEEDGDLKVDGNVTAQNVFIPALIFSHTNATLTVTVPGTWYNVTFDEEAADIKQGITHSIADSTNDTFTIISTGTYMIRFAGSYENTVENQDVNIAHRIVRNGVEIPGSVWEVDTDKKDFDRVKDSYVVAALSIGDKIKMQFTTNSTDTHLESDCTYGIHCDSASIFIERIM